MSRFNKQRLDYPASDMIQSTLDFTIHSSVHIKRL